MMRRPRSRYALIVAAAIALQCSARFARADPTPAARETARALVEEGDRRLAAADLPGALQAYRAAHAIMGVPTTGIEVARTLDKMGLLVEARDAALAVTRIPAKIGEPAVFAQSRAEADRLADRLAPRIPSLSIAVKSQPIGGALRVDIDGAPLAIAALGLPQKVNPGKHVVSAAADGFRSAKREVLVREGESFAVEIPLDPDRALPPKPVLAPTPAPAAGPEPSPGLPVLGFVGIGVAALGVGVGTVTGILSLSKASDAKTGCVGNICPIANEVSSKADASSSKTLADVSDVAFGLAIAGAAVGAYEVFFARRTKQTERGAVLHVDYVLLPAWLGVTGSF